MPVRSALLSMIADSDPCLWWQDPADGRIRWSRGVAAALGRPRDRQPDDPSLLERLHPDDRQATLDVIREAVATRRAFRHESRLLAEQGEEWCPTYGPQALVSADLDRLEHVLLDLITNAVKFTEQKGVTLPAEAAGDNVRFIVEDSGQGIDPTFFPHAFEPFRQQSSVDNRQFGGSDLGLSIARGFVQHIGGSLRLESRVGQGTTAVVELPRRSGTAAPTSPFERASATDMTADEAQLRILVLEDDEASRGLICQVGSDFAEVTSTADSESALAALEAATFDLLLFDSDPAGSPRDGLQTLAAARAAPIGATAPAIAVTAFVDPAEISALRRSGFDGVLGRPWSSADLRAIVRRHAERR